MIDDHVLQRQKRLLRKGQRAQVTPASKRIPLLQPPGGKKQPNHSRWEGGEETSREPTRGTPPTPLNGHAPLTEGWVDDGETQGVRLSKKSRRRRKGCRRSRKGEPEGRVTAPTTGAMKNASHCAPDHSNTWYTSQETHTKIPLHLAHVGCGS